MQYSDARWELSPSRAIMLPIYIDIKSDGAVIITLMATKNTVYFSGQTTAAYGLV